MGMRLRRIWPAAKGGGATPFVGMCDAIPDIAHFYQPACRVLSAYTGNLVRLRRESDDAEADFTYVAATGELDVAAIAAWAGGAAYVVTVYDQKGGLNVTQATKANQPLYVAAGQNGKPVMRGDGTDYLVSAAAAVFKNAGAGSLVCVSRNTVTAGSHIPFIVSVGVPGSAASARTTLQYNDANVQGGGRRLDANTFQNIAGAGHTANVAGIYQSRFDWTNSNLYVLKNGTQIAEKLDFQDNGSTSDTNTQGVGLFAGVLGGNPLTGDIASAVILNSAAVATDLVTALNAYWAVY